MFRHSIATEESISVHMQLLISRMEVIRWSLCQKQRLRSVVMLALEDDRNIAHGITTTRKWLIRRLLGTCGSTCRLVLKYNKQSHMTREQHDPLRISHRKMNCF